MASQSQYDQYVQSGTLGGVRTEVGDGAHGYNRLHNRLSHGLALTTHTHMMWNIEDPAWAMDSTIYLMAFKTTMTKIVGADDGQCEPVLHFRRAQDVSICHRVACAIHK
eukprot:5637666-Amphidinium_carterae.1